MVSRNPRLHAVFGTMELAEERGLGLKSMRNRATEAGLPLPKYSITEPYLDLVIYRTAGTATQILPKEILAQLSKTERMGWEWLAAREVVTAAEYEAALEIPRRTALNHLKHFVELGFLNKEGSGISTKYRIIRL